MGLVTRERLADSLRPAQGRDQLSVVPTG
jgi:hypothetical protein